MCGIVGCVGHENAIGFTLDGLVTLENRGYDSMGIAFPEPLEPEQPPGIWTPRLKVIKSLAGVSGIEQALLPQDHTTTTAVGHTRWATHGTVSKDNAHPHTNTDRTTAVVHNGLIENYAELKRELEDDGYVFSSQTDTEVIPHLIDYYTRDGQEPEEAFRSAVRRLTGAYAILACQAQHPDTLYAARLGSPLVLGVNGSEHFAASVSWVWQKHTKKAIWLEDEQIGIVSTDGYEIKSLQGKHIPTAPEELSGDFETADMGEYPHWMLKEIHDQPETVRAALSGRVFPEQNMVKLGGLEGAEIQEKLRQTERIIIVSCGTSYNAGLIGKRLIEELARIPVEVELASEFATSNTPLSSKTAVLAISQSGETADTRAAIEKANKVGLLTLGINNTPGSIIDQITDAGVHCRAGQENSVASTKAFTSQVIVLAEIALALSRESSNLHQPLMQELVALPDKIKQVLEMAPRIEEVVKKYANYEHCYFLGRGYEYASAEEGALKLKEISYIHAEAYAAGEMKHGPIALIDKNFLTFAIATDSAVYEKTLSNISEIKTRSGPVIALATEGNESIHEKVDDVIYVPASIEQTQPIINAVAMQLFAYFVAVEKGLDVDRPRNLAKSVTVE
jgi:glucosamine--fructose-6-phosphate aminotransferase (isomerizing)